MVQQYRHATGAEEAHGPMWRLTERERSVLALLAAGKSNKEIARALFITPHTAKAHVSRILHKLGVESRTEAAVLYVRNEG
jgi:DNA-binding NarL/FixJ family response regulator